MSGSERTPSPIERITEGVAAIHGEVSNVRSYADDLEQAVKAFTKPEQPLTEDEHFFARHAIKETAAWLLQSIVQLQEVVEPIAEAGDDLMEGEIMIVRHEVSGDE